MKYIKLFENFKSLEDKLKEYGIKNYTINDDGTIDVNGDVQLSKRNLEKIPFKFGKVTGGFFVGACDIKTLEGCPYEIEGDFDCSSNRLGSFEFGPIEVGGSVYAAGNRFNTLEHMPLEIGGDFIIYNNPNLKKLDSVSNIEGDIYCEPNLDKSKFIGYCKNIYDGSIEPENLNESIISQSKLEYIETLKKLGITQNYKINLDGTVDVDGDVYLHKCNLEVIPIQFGKVSGFFIISNNKLTSLNGCPYYVGEYFNCTYNKLKDLVGGPEEVGGSYLCYNNDLRSLDGVALEIGESLNITRNQLNEIDIISNIEGDIYCDKEVDIDTFRGYCREIKPNLI